MNLEMRREGIMALSAIVHRMSLAGIDTREKFREWAKKEVASLNHFFNYTQKPGMPPIYSLVSVDFHPELPLMMFNYSPVAHNTLYAHPEGWTNALRMCRGIVFELGTGKLIAHPFPKFFNLNEHPETMLEVIIEKLVRFDRDGQVYGWDAAEKMDGHLGIIFEYAGQLLFTTRGRFGSPSAKLGAELLRRYEQECDWKNAFNPDFTILVEFIDPSTKVHVDYGERSEFVLLGAFDRGTLFEIHNGMSGAMEVIEETLWWKIAQRLRLNNLPNGYLRSKKAGPISDFTKLVASMKDRTVTNEEGFVIRLFDGTRFKVKYEAYIGLMVQKKLSPTYLMNRMMAGNLDKMLLTLQEEVVPAAHEMLGRIMRVQFMPTLTEKQRRQYLYGLVSSELSKEYYRGICRKFIAFLDSHWVTPQEVDVLEDE